MRLLGPTNLVRVRVRVRVRVSVRVEVVGADQPSRGTRREQG